MENLKEKIKQSVDFIKSKSKIEPKIGIILGTGMGGLADKIKNADVISYENIPNFPVSTVESHKGNLHLGELGGKKVFVMQGRFHFYEGYSMKEITFPIRVMKALGVTTLIVMNASGSMNPLINAGNLVLITDHINMMGDNPLIGKNYDDLGPRFPDMSEPYSRRLIKIADEVALENKIKVNKAVIIAVTGPCLETAAEYRFFRRVGADIITMSTIPEVIVAVHSGMEVLGISTVTDNCLPDALKPADINDIIKVANAAEPKLNVLVPAILEKI